MWDFAGHSDEGGRHLSFTKLIRLLSPEAPVLQVQAEKKKYQAEAAERARRKAEQAKQALEAFQRMNNVQADPNAPVAPLPCLSKAHQLYTSCTSAAVRQPSISYPLVW